MPSLPPFFFSFFSYGRLVKLTTPPLVLRRRRKVFRLVFFLGRRRPPSSLLFLLPPFFRPRAPPQVFFPVRWPLMLPPGLIWMRRRFFFFFFFPGRKNSSKRQVGSARPYVPSCDLCNGILLFFLFSSLKGRTCPLRVVSIHHFLRPSKGDDFFPPFPWKEGRGKNSPGRGRFRVVSCRGDRPPLPPLFFFF